MNIIISGADGFIGKALVNQLLKLGHYVYALVGPKFSGSLSESTNIYILKIDLANKNEFSKILTNINYDIFIHLAWIGTSGISRNDYNIQKLNVELLYNILNLCSQLKIKRFVGAGSIIEDETIIATNNGKILLSNSYVYGITKLMTHTISKIYCNNNNIEFIWPKITNAYGPGEISPRFINTTLRKIINNEDLSFSKGLQNYNFIFIDDLVDSFIRTAFYGKSNQSYILSSGVSMPLKKYIIKLIKITGFKGRYKFDSKSFNVVNLPISYFSNKELVRDTSFKNRYSFKTGIIKTYNWLKNNEKD